MKSNIPKLNCLSLNPTTPAFRLKRDHKNLETKEYVKSLMPYLDNTESCKNFTLDNLNVLYGLASAMALDANIFGDNIALEKHFAVHWYEEKVEWYLGVVVDVFTDILRISHLKRSRKCDFKWVFLESAGKFDKNSEEFNGKI